MYESKQLELWADSFHEGQWACDQLGIAILAHGGQHSLRFEHGFIPVHSYAGDTWRCDITVYGDYRAWDSRPAVISQLLEWGKPDLALYDAHADRLVFAVEETAATPTGNQALQRCERQYGAIKLKVPFWYLLSEFGLHSDGAVRRDSIWPTIVALKMSQDVGVPSLVLHYSDLAAPEDYSAGSGLRMLFEALLLCVRNSASGLRAFEGMAPALTEQYTNMLAFVGRQWPNQIDFLPGGDALTDVRLPQMYARAATGSEQAEGELWSEGFLRWPLVAGVPVHPNGATVAVSTDDALAQRMEADIRRRRAYGLSGRKGSKPQPREDVEAWLAAQRQLFLSAPVQPGAQWTLNANSFLRSPTGLLHVSRSQRITYLYDSWAHFVEAATSVYPRLQDTLPSLFNDDKPTFVYISNSIKPGRIFGDPFTGQIAAFSVAFGKLDPAPRRVVAYFPHQAHAQALDALGRRNNKGVTIMRELTDVLLFAGGVGVTLHDGRVL